MKISKYKVETRRFIAFVNTHEIPVRPLSNAFLYDVFLNSSFATKERIANELKVAIEYFDSLSIDLEYRVASGKFLTSSEISAFYGKMKLKKESFESEQKISTISNAHSKNIRNAIAASIYVSNKVSTQTCTGRVRTLRKYLDYLFNYFHGDKVPTREISESFKTMSLKIKIKEDYGSVEPTSSPVSIVDSVIPDNVYDLFLEVIKPSDLRNPFKGSKLRNYLILSLMAQTGLRRSEVCKIKISDCQLYDDFNKIKVYSTPNDPTDPRLNKPNKKTGRAHLSGINSSLMYKIDFYIKSVRNNFPKSSTHDFLFVSEKDSRGTVGLPITRDLINYMLSKASRVVNFKIHPHLFRHKWNERLSINGRKKELDNEYLEDIRRNAMGWTADSKMGRIYNDKIEQLTAMELMTEHQEIIDGVCKK